MSIEVELAGAVLRSVLDALPRGVVVATASGQILLWSAGAERLLGWSAHEIVGRSITDLLPASDAPGPATVVDLTEEALAQGRHELVHRDGYPIPVLVAMTPIPHEVDGEGLVVAAVTDGATDVNELQDEARALSTHLRLALDAGGFGTWRWDRASGKTVWDSEMERLFGLEPGTFDGTFEAWRALVHPDDWSEVLAVLDDALVSRQPYRVTHRVIRPDGTTRWIEGAGRVTFGSDGEVTGTIGCSHDVTERAEVAAEQERLRDVAGESLRSERLLRERLELVAAVNEALEDSDDLPDLMRKVTRAVVPRSADWCSLHLFDDAHDPIPIVEVAHRDPAMVRFAREAMERHPYDPDAHTGVAEVIRTRRPLFHPAIDEALITGSDLSDEEQGLVRRLALRSAIAVPVMKRGRVFGALQLVTSNDSRHYSEDDLALAEVLAARIAATLDNRRLRDERGRTARTDAGLARLGRRLAAAASLEEVLAVILEDAASVLGAARVSVGLLRDRVSLAMHGFPEPSLDLAGAGPVADALATADPVLRDRDPWAGAAGLLSDGADGALVASPLFDDVHQTMGVLVLSWARPVSFDEEDLNTIETLSRLCGQSIVRSQLASNTEAMAELAAAMAAARTTADVALLLRDHTSRHLGSSATSLRLLDTDQMVLLAAVDSELPPAVAERYRRVALQRATPLSDAVKDNAAVWIEDLEVYGRRYPDLAPEMDDLGIAATAAIPLGDSDGRAVGAVALAWPAPMRFDPRFRSRVATICDLAGQTLERVRLFEAEHAVVASMQRRLLAPLPTPEGLEVAAHYEPAAATVGMGGDWYEATVLPDGSLLAIIGDVVGHGVEAVAAMAQIQHLLTGLIHAGVPPHELFAITNTMIGGADRIYATALLLHVDEARRRIGYVSAGHPPPLVRHADGTITVLAGNQQAMLGLDVPVVDLVYADLPPGALVLGYTDGLVERRGETIDDGTARLADHLTRLDDAEPIDLGLRRLVAEVRGADPERRPTTDDIAALLLRTPG
ncbi:MAG: GAF domain-containing protein [Aquihabitans sp.]